jgi:hypothetical protein
MLTCQYGITQNLLFKFQTGRQEPAQLAKGYGDKTRWTDSQNSHTTASSGRELYYLQFSLQAASPETFGYTLV